MKVSLIRGNTSDSGFLKKIAFNIGPFDSLVGSEIYLNVFSESTRILVSHCLAVAKSLENRIASQYLFLYRMLLLFLTQTGQHLHAIFSSFCLTSPRLSRYNNCLLLNLIEHSLKNPTSHGVNVRLLYDSARQHLFSKVFYHLLTVESWEFFVWIEGDESGSNISVNLILFVSLNKIANNSLFG